MNENEYMVYFDFTTVHKGSKFVGRHGEISVITKASMEDIQKDRETIEQMCVDAMLELKPKWNIFMITIKQILPKT